MPKKTVKDILLDSMHGAVFLGTLAMLVEMHITQYLRSSDFSVLYQHKFELSLFLVAPLLLSGLYVKEFLMNKNFREQNSQPMENTQQNTAGSQDHCEKAGLRARIAQGENSHTLGKGAELGNCIAKGTNSYVLGISGTGKSTYMLGVVVMNMSRSFKEYSNIVVVDAGRSYEAASQLLKDSEFINITPMNETTLAPITLSGKKLTVFELEKIKYLKSNAITEQLIEALKKATSIDSLLIIDEWWIMNSAIKKWALTVFEGHTIVSAMREDDLTHDKAYHLFDSGIELHPIKQKGSALDRTI